MLKKFNSSTKKLNRVVQTINTNNLTNADLTGSLLNIVIPTNPKFESNSKSNPNPIKLVNNKNKISEFYNEILQFSAMSVKRRVDLFDNTGFGSLTIRNVALDYGTEGASSENFEVLVYGLHIPGDYSIKEIGNDVVVTLNNDYIDFDTITINEIYVIGKLLDIPIATEMDFIIITEDGSDIII